MTSKQEVQKKTSKPEKPQIERKQVEQEPLPFEHAKASFSSTLPNHPTTRPLRQAQILQMQRTYGNAYVQRHLADRNRQNGIANDYESSIQEAPAEQTTPTTDASAATTQVPLPPITSRAFYWSVDYKNLQSYILPRRSFNLQQLAMYCYGNEAATAKLASLNGISPDAQLEPGMRIRVTGIKGMQPTRRAGKSFQSSPHVPIGETDPAGWFAAMGVSSPEEFHARKIALDMLVNNDFLRIVSILDESHYSDSDEGQVISMLRKWSKEKLTPNSRTYPYGGYYFDQLLKKLRWKTKKIGWVSEEISDYYSMMFNHFDRASEVKSLVNQNSMLFEGDTGLKELSVTDAIVDAAKGLPGAITMTAGAFVGMLPGKWANKASNWLNKTGKDYLKTIGWDDDMIEMSAGISGLTGMTISALMPGGPAAKLAHFWSKAEKIVGALQNILEVKELLVRLGEIKDEVKAKVEAILSLITNTDKLVPYLLGFEEDKTGIADWVLAAPSEETGAAGGKGIKGLANKFKAVINKVRAGLQPIFKVRARFIEMMEVIGGLVLQIPMAEELLEMALNPKKRNMRTFRKITKRFSNQLGEMLQQKVELVREMIEARIEEFFDKKELITRDQVYEQVAQFIKGYISKENAAIGDILNTLDKDNSKLKEHIVIKLLPDELMGVVDIVNEKFQALLAQFQPAVQMVKDGLKTIAEGINKTLKKVLVKPITDALLQLSPMEDSLERSITAAISAKLLPGDDNKSNGISDSHVGMVGGLARNGSHGRQSKDQLRNQPISSQANYGIRPQTIQRALDFDSLREKLVKRFGDRVLETLTFAKGATKEEKEKIKEIQDAVARLRGREVQGRNNPQLPEAYYYTPQGEGMPTGIKRKSGWKNYVPKLIIKKTKTTSRIELGFFERHIKQKQTEEAEAAHKAVMAELGSESEELLKGHGEYTRGRKRHNFTTEEYDRVDEIGYKTGCHSTGVKDPGTKLGHRDKNKKETKAYKAGKPNWIPDHQPPNTIWEGGGAREGIRFYPHSKAASSRQFRLANSYRAKMMKRLGRSKSDWAVGIKSSWFWS